MAEGLELDKVPSHPSCSDPVKSDRLWSSFYRAPALCTYSNLYFPFCKQPLFSLHSTCSHQQEKPASAEPYVRLESLKRKAKCVGRSDNWEGEKWGERRTGCWVNPSWFKLEQSTSYCVLLKMSEQETGIVVGEQISDKWRVMEPLPTEKVIGLFLVAFCSCLHHLCVICSPKPLLSWEKLYLWHG